VEATTRKLIRPIVPPAGKDRPMGKPPAAAPPGGGGAPRKSGSGPAESTNAENFYYTKQIQLKTPMVIVLKDSEELHGIIEWYDKACIKLALDGGGVAMVYKASIKYMYKDE
jgi:sRNA-binding regulator protein Hfq